MWYCVSLDGDRTSGYCMPVVTCSEGFGCDFVDATCGMACPETGCFNFCAPDVLRPTM
jgi:hypothetical protein